MKPHQPMGSITAGNNPLFSGFGHGFEEREVWFFVLSSKKRFFNK
jgi:hypothetical protein